MEGEGNSSPSCDNDIDCSDSQTDRVAPADSRKILELHPVECSSKQRYCTEPSSSSSSTSTSYGESKSVAKPCINVCHVTANIFTGLCVPSGLLCISPSHHRQWQCKLGSQAKPDLYWTEMENSCFIYSS